MSQDDLQTLVRFLEEFSYSIRRPTATRRRLENLMRKIMREGKIDKNDFPIIKREISRAKRAGISVPDNVDNFLENILILIIVFSE